VPDREARSVGLQAFEDLRRFQNCYGVAVDTHQGESLRRPPHLYAQEPRGPKNQLPAISKNLNGVGSDKRRMAEKRREGGLDDEGGGFRQS
jgi:hypothetical protein